MLSLREDHSAVDSVALAGIRWELPLDILAYLHAVLWVDGAVVDNVMGKGLKGKQEPLFY